MNKKSKIVIASLSLVFILVSMLFCKICFFEISVTIKTIILYSVLLVVLTSFVLGYFFSKKYNSLKTKLYLDDLTHIANNKAFNKDLSKILDSKKDQPTALFLIDVDNFKVFNTEIGYDSTNELLIEIVKLLNQDKRATDTLYRYHKAGDEFMIIARKTNYEQAGFAIERKRVIIEEAEIFLDDKTYKTTVTCGYTILKENDTYKSVTKRVNVALQIGKKNKKNSINFM
jgi:diguanylate cyclase (GGDEF)-like protein